MCSHDISGLKSCKETVQAPRGKIYCICKKCNEIILTDNTEENRKILYKDCKHRDKIISDIQVNDMSTRTECKECSKIFITKPNSCLIL